MSDQKLAPVLADRIELWPVDRLVPYDRNPRTHSLEQLAQLRASIQEFGFTNPILVDGKDGILAGHGRLMAAKDMGLQQVPVVVLDHLTPEQRRAYVIADNQLALNAGWDMDILRDELLSLDDLDFDLDLLGFSETQLIYFKDGVGEWDSDIENKVDDVEETDESAPSVIRVTCAQQDKDDVRDWLKQQLENTTGFEGVTVE